MDAGDAGGAMRIATKVWFRRRGASPGCRLRWVLGHEAADLHLGPTAACAIVPRLGEPGDACSVSMPMWPSAPNSRSDDGLPIYHGVLWNWR